MSWIEIAWVVGTILVALVAYQAASGVWSYAAASLEIGRERTALALSTLHLFTGPTAPTPLDTAASMNAREASYDGYALKTLTTWNGPYQRSDLSAAIQSGSQQFDYGPVGSPPVLNTVTGWYVLLAGGTLYQAGMLDAPAEMRALGQSVIVDLILPFGGGMNRIVEEDL